MENSGGYPGRTVEIQQQAQAGNAKPGLLDEAGSALEGIAHRIEASVMELQEHMNKIVGVAPPVGNSQPAPPAAPPISPAHKQARLHMTFSRLQNLSQWLEREVGRVKQL